MTRALPSPPSRSSASLSSGSTPSPVSARPRHVSQSDVDLTVDSQEDDDDSDVGSDLEAHDNQNEQGSDGDVSDSDLGDDDQSGDDLDDDDGEADTSGAQPTKRKRKRRAVPRVDDLDPVSMTKLKQWVTMFIRKYPDECYSSAREYLATRLWCHWCKKVVRVEKTSTVAKHPDGAKHQRHRTDPKHVQRVRNELHQRQLGRRETSASGTAPQILATTPVPAAADPPDEVRDGDISVRDPDKAQQRQTFLKMSVSAGLTRRQQEKVLPFAQTAGYDIGHLSNINRDQLTAVHTELRTNVTAILGGSAAPKMSIVFDGSTVKDDLIVALSRSMTEDVHLQQILIRGVMLGKSPASEALAQTVTAALSDLDIKFHNILAFITDNAPVNPAAIRLLRTVNCPAAIHIGCMSHILDRSGLKFATIYLKAFQANFNSVMSDESYARNMWVTLTGTQPPPGYSKTRWWSAWMTLCDIYKKWDQLPKFLQSTDKQLNENQHFVNLTTPLKTKEALATLQMEAAAVVSGGKRIVEFTYILEGDGLLVFRAFDLVQQLLEVARSTAYDFAEIQLVAKKMAAEKLLPSGAKSSDTKTTQLREDAWVSYGNACIKGAYDYIVRKFTADDKQATMHVMEAARICHPNMLTSLYSSCEVALKSGFELLVLVPLVSTQFLEALRGEFSRYWTQARLYKIAPVQLPKNRKIADPECMRRRLEDEALMSWWRSRRFDLPACTELFKMFCCLQPSSAAAERVFSLFGDLYRKDRRIALEDHVESSLMLNINDDRCLDD